MVFSLFRFVSVNFGITETPKLAVSLCKRNSQYKLFVSDSAETSFGSSFGCFELKLVSKDTLRLTDQMIKSASGVNTCVRVQTSKLIVVRTGNILVMTT
jgi:hypothetical protein